MIHARAIGVTAQFSVVHCLVSRKESSGLRSKHWQRFGYRDSGTRKRGRLVTFGSCDNALGRGSDALTFVGLPGIDHTEPSDAIKPYLEDT